MNVVNLEWVMRLRKAGKNQNDLAKVTGLHYSAISRYLRGEWSPSDDNARRIEKGLQKLERK